MFTAVVEETLWRARKRPSGQQLKPHAAWNYQYFPTLSSSTIPMIRAAAETTEKMMAEPNSPVLGLHLEGHYFQYGDGRRTDSGEYQRS